MPKKTPLSQDTVKNWTKPWKEGKTLFNAFRNKANRIKHYCMQYEDAYSLFHPDDHETDDLILHLGLVSKKECLPVLGFGKEPDADFNDMKERCYAMHLCTGLSKDPIEYIIEEIDNLSNPSTVFNRLRNEDIFFFGNLEPKEIKSLTGEWGKLKKKDFNPTFLAKTVESNCKKNGSPNEEDACRVRYFNFIEHANDLRDHFIQEPGKDPENEPRLVLSMGCFQEENFPASSTARMNEFKAQKQPFRPILRVVAPDHHQVNDQIIQFLMPSLMATGIDPDWFLPNLESITSFSKTRVVAYDLARPCPDQCSGSPR